MTHFMVTAMLIATMAAAHADLELVREGQPVAEIVLGDQPSAAAQGAATELQVFLKRMSGAELPIVPRPGGAGRVAVLIGQDAVRAFAPEVKVPSGLTHDFDDEGYVVATAPAKLILAGNETEPYEGTWYAVYDLLESLGCRWYFPGAFGEVVPTLSTIAIPAQRRLVKPDLRVRDTWYSGHLVSTSQQQAEFATWKRRNRMTRAGFWGHCANPDSRFLQNPVDDSTYRLLPKEKYWDTHPEYYALMPGGQRNERFLCMSSPGALQAAVDTVCEYFATYPDNHTFAFSPPDEPVLCHCPDCTRAMNQGFDGEGWGDVSDPYFRFVLALADKVRERYPDRWITTMAYYNRCRPPQGVTGERPNLLIQHASIQQCSLHSYQQEGCWSRRQFGEMLRQWAELSAGQVFYEYDPHDWTHLQRPAWGSQREADDLRVLKRLDGWGFSDEGQMAWMSTGLNYYVRAKLAWNVQQDPAAMVSDFCQRFFGPASRPMWRFYTAIENAIRTTRAHSGGFPGRDDWQVILPRPLLDQCQGWLAEAAGLAGADPYRTRVNAFRIYFDRINAYVRMREAMNRADFAEAARQADAMVEAVTRMGDTALLQDAGPWGGSRSGAQFARNARELLAWTDGTKGKLVAVLPPVADFRTDPAGDGLVGRWYLDQGSDGWRKLPMTSAWESQGVVTPQGRSYSGVAWYRAELNLPAAPAGTVRLFIPELGGTAAWVWCNGTYAGDAIVGQDNPLTVRLSGLLKAGHNRLVIRLKGNAGLSLPPFIFEPTPAAEFPEDREELRVIPAQWLFRTDPQQQGEAEGWQTPDVDETAWQSIPVPSAWEETAVGPYDGVAWYRVRFTIPGEAAGRKLVLHFDGVDEEAWVFLNGELQGQHTEQSTGETVHQIWDQPFTVPLTAARPGQENLLVVRVRDSTMAGGIHRPVRLYMAPERDES
ncbi:MAG: DUF4838 domain-containing protein [Armatimonadetes bacterium]|nr:DUF4838 domain-containing protein [Armatimonadota bacterium]